MARKPFTLKQRRAWSQWFGHRPLNNWGSGDLPAPWCPGDVVVIDHERAAGDLEFLRRLDQSINGADWIASARRNSKGGRDLDWRRGYFVVCSAFSVDEGDGWYFRVTYGGEGSSDRLHVFTEHGTERGKAVDFMAPFTLVETADPDGLVERERLLGNGWRYKRQAA